MSGELSVEERVNRVEAEQTSIRDEMRAGFARLEARFDQVPTRAEMQAADDRLLATMEQWHDQSQQWHDESVKWHEESQRRHDQSQKWHDESVAADVELREYIEFVSARHATETRRHFEIVAEGLRDDIRKLADGQAATNQRLDATNGRLDATNDKLDGIRSDIARLAAATTRGRRGPVR